MNDRTPPVRSGYARADDGVQLFWRATGAGPAIVCCNGVGVSTFFWKYVTAAFAHRFTVIVWDYRAHGRSDRVVDPATADLRIERHAQDLGAILDTVGIAAPAMLVGHSMGCQVALEVLRQDARRVGALVLMLGTAGHALHTFFDFPDSPKIFRELKRLVDRLGERTNDILHPILASSIAWTVTRRMALVDPMYASSADMREYLDHLASLDFRVFLQAVLDADAHSAWDVLPTVRVPVLVIAAENDKFTPLWCSRDIVARTPGAEFLMLADASHAALIEQPDTINTRLDRFIRERWPVA